jgi:hypothetical protein
MTRVSTALPMSPTDTVSMSTSDSAHAAGKTAVATENTATKGKGGRVFLVSNYRGNRQTNQSSG